MPTYSVYKCGMQVTPQQRNEAKQMAYALLYGQGHHALAKEMGCAPDQAAAAMKKFRRSIPALVRRIALLHVACWIVQYQASGGQGDRAHVGHDLSPEHRHWLILMMSSLLCRTQDAWLKSVVAQCKRSRFVVTLGKRRRYLPDIVSADRRRCTRAERQAVNSAVQGSAADVCKAAMVALHRRLLEAFPAAPKACRLLLQVRLVVQHPLCMCNRLLVNLVIYLPPGQPWRTDAFTKPSGMLWSSQWCICLGTPVGVECCFEAGIGSTRMAAETFPCSLCRFTTSSSLRSRRPPCQRPPA